MSYQALKERHRAERVGFHENLSLRTHRALSWLKRAEQSDDLDTRFIALWIAFNAAYATDLHRPAARTSESQLFKGFFTKLVQLDQQQSLYELVWSEFSSPVRLLLGNPYIFQPFWDFHNGLISEAEWKAAEGREKKSISWALAHQDTAQLLSLIVRRIYTLRNQILHGGATWQSSANRDQLRDCTAFLQHLLPILITLMMDHPDSLWGDPYYPYVQAG